VRHAILGAGGVGGLLGGALARAGREVTLILRPATLYRHPDRVAISSPALGDFEANVRLSARLDEPVDVLWVTVKATQLEQALEAAPPEAGGKPLVVPLLNGLDHMVRLREVYGAERVIAGSMRVEAERTEPGRIVQKTRFSLVELSGHPELCRELEAAGIDCRLVEDEATLLWSKLALLAPMALATTAAAASIGAVRSDPRSRLRLEAAVREACLVAAAEGARLDEAAIAGNVMEMMPPDMQSSMQKDVAAGRQPELDAIAGPILRQAGVHGIAVPAMEELVAQVRDRARA
jgi:2-dehydropantoate 2-reductase